MTPTKTESFPAYLLRNSNIFQNLFDKISENRMIDIEQVTLFDVAKNEQLYEYELMNNNRSVKITNYPDQPMRSPLTVESLRFFVIDQAAQYSLKEAKAWATFVKSTKVLFRCYNCKTYHVRAIKFFSEGNNEECKLCLYSYDVIQHRMNEMGFDVEGTEKEWNERNAGIWGTKASFNLVYDDCDCTKKCTLHIKELNRLKRRLAARTKQIATDGTYSCPNKSGAGFNQRQIGDFGEEYVKNDVRKFCCNHDLPGRICYAFECGPADLIFGIAEEKHQTKYDIMYIQIQIKTKSNNATWTASKSYPDDTLGILLNIDKKSEDATVDLVIMETWNTLTSDITVVPGRSYVLAERKMLDYEIADMTDVTPAIMMFYYKAVLNNTTMTYDAAFRPWPNHKTVSQEFKCYQSTVKTNQKWCVYQCLEPPYSKADNTITMKVKINNDYTKALKKKLFYEIERDNTEGCAIIRVNDQSKCWDGVDMLKYLSTFDRPIYYEGSLAKKICDQVHAFHWYHKSTDNNYLIPFAKLYDYVTNPNVNKMENKIDYSSVLEKLIAEDGNWHGHFEAYSYKYNTAIPIGILSSLINMKVKDILVISINYLPGGEVGFVKIEDTLIKIRDLYNGYGR